MGGWGRHKNHAHRAPLSLPTAAHDAGHGSQHLVPRRGRGSGLPAPPRGGHGGSGQARGRLAGWGAWTAVIARAGRGGTGREARGVMARDTALPSLRAGLPPPTCGPPAASAASTLAAPCRRSSGCTRGRGPRRPTRWSWSASSRSSPPSSSRRERGGTRRGGWLCATARTQRAAGGALPPRPPHPRPHPFPLLRAQRIVRLGGPVDDDMANLVVAQLLYLDSADPARDVTLYINSPGGSVTAGASHATRAGVPAQAPPPLVRLPTLTPRGAQAWPCLTR